MTQVKQKAFELLENISDEKAAYVIKFMRAIEDDTETETSAHDYEKRQAAFEGFMKYAGRLPADFDYKRELAEYREERYGSSVRH
jgi:hypothetical protein